MESPASALEQFRKQWREEVKTRHRKDPKRQSPDYETLRAELPQSPDQPRRRSSLRGHQPGPRSLVDDASDTLLEEQGSRLTDRFGQITRGSADKDDFDQPTSTKEPESALEHFERAVEREDQGSLGESLSHYRKAYRLDAEVDKSYKQKHFPPNSKAGSLNPSNAAVTVPSTAHHSSKDLAEPVCTQTLIASFAGLPIEGAPPAVTGDSPPSCPMSRLPLEIILEILMETAILDPASFARLATVCKRLAYHVFSETQIWKRVALGPEFGLESQVYRYKTDVLGREAVNQSLDSPLEPVATPRCGQLDATAQDWRHIFHTYPRVRFTGVYISTVNYTRVGGASATQATWSTPVHIVTYYRYLRFFCDGTVISLLSTNEPVEVVRHLTKENVVLARGGKEHHPLNFTSGAVALNGTPAQAAAPAAHQLLKHALRGRWRLSPPQAAEPDPSVDPVTVGSGTEGTLYIETEGAGPRYLYTMQLAMKSGSRAKHAVKNNKLQWKAYWSFNHLTNDWAPFQLKNDRPYFFSRVKSYGLGY